MFYYISVIAFIILSPVNIPVEEKAIVGPFPEQYQCETFKAQIENMNAGTYNAELKTSNCIEQATS